MRIGKTQLQMRSISIGVLSFACASGGKSTTAPDAPRLPAVREELLSMANEDQQARLSTIKNKDPALWHVAEQMDQKHTARLKAIVTNYGWPGKSLVGDDGAHAAWLLVQHADKDPAFQKHCLEKMKDAFKAGEASGRDLAYLVDRVAVAENRGQIYGTQFIYTDECEAMKPLPIVDEQHLDERRKSVGLTGMAEYIEDVRRMYCEPGSTNQ